MWKWTTSKRSRAKSRSSCARASARACPIRYVTSGESRPARLSSGTTVTFGCSAGRGRAAAPPSSSVGVDAVDDGDSWPRCGQLVGQPVDVHRVAAEVVRRVERRDHAERERARRSRVVPPRARASRSRSAAASQVRPATARPARGERRRAPLRRPASSVERSRERAASRGGEEERRRRRATRGARAGR